MIPSWFKETFVPMSLTHFDPLKSDFLDPSGIAKILPEGRNFLWSLKKQEFSVEIFQFTRNLCLKPLIHRFSDGKSMKNQ